VLLNNNKTILERIKSVLCRVLPEDIKLSDAERIYDSNEDFDWEGFLDDTVDTGQYSQSEEKEVPPLENILTRPQSLQNYLLWQLRMSLADEKEFWVGEFIIGNIDENGYFQSSCADIAQAAVLTEPDITTKDVDKVLCLIQTFEPAGICAKDLCNIEIILSTTSPST